MAYTKEKHFIKIKYIFQNIGKQTKKIIRSFQLNFIDIYYEILKQISVKSPLISIKLIDMTH